MRRITMPAVYIRRFNLKDSLSDATVIEHWRFLMEEVLPAIQKKGEHMGKSIATIVMVLFALAGQISAQGSSPADEKAVRSNVDEWVAAHNKGDAKAIAQLVTEDIEEVEPDGRHTKGRAAYEKGLASWFASRQGTPSLSVTTVFVRFLKPDVAIAGGTWTATGGAAGPEKGSWMATYVQQGGKWLTSGGLAATAPPPTR
jgi:uncharacterized protein (TIGR02246 family)